MEKAMQWFKPGAAILGALSSFLFGGWTMLLSVLLGLVILDYVSGVAAAAVEGNVSSKIGFKSFPKKILIFVIVAGSHLIDTVVGQGSMVMDAAIFFYAANEFISITENAGRVGLPVPDQVKNMIAALKNKTSKPPE